MPFLHSFACHSLVEHIRTFPLCYIAVICMYENHIWDTFTTIFTLLFKLCVSSPFVTLIWRVRWYLESHISELFQTSAVRNGNIFRVTVLCTYSRLLLTSDYWFPCSSGSHSQLIYSFPLVHSSKIWKRQIHPCNQNRKRIKHESIRSLIPPGFPIVRFIRCFSLLGFVAPWNGLNFLRPNENNVCMRPQWGMRSRGVDCWWVKYLKYSFVQLGKEHVHTRVYKLIKRVIYFKNDIKKWRLQAKFQASHRLRF